MKQWVRIILSILILGPLPALARELYVGSRTAPMLAAPSFQAERLATLPQGTVVTELESRKGWYRVQYQNRQGWILQLMLSETEPAAGPALADEDVAAMAARSRRRPSAFANTAAARGFRKRTDTGKQALGIDFSAVEAMEHMRVGNAEALAFLHKGLEKGGDDE